MFKSIVRVLMIVWYSIINIITTIITGKYVTVSPYRLIKENDVDFLKIASVKYIKEDRYTHISNCVKDRIIREYNEHLHNCPNFKKARGLNFPIFDGEKIIGRKSLMTVMSEERTNFLNKEKI
jgi:hypothetical protein